MVAGPVRAVMAEAAGAAAAIYRAQMVSWGIGLPACREVLGTEINLVLGVVAA